MNIVIQLLLQLLPQLLQWLLSLIQRNQKLTGRQLRLADEINWYCRQICDCCPACGCTVGGVPPAAKATDESGTMKYADEEPDPTP